MKKTKLGTNNASIPEKIVLARAIAEGLTKNAASFANPKPTPAEITAAAAELETAAADAVEARQKSQAATVAQEQTEDALDDLLSQAASYVDTVAKGDESIILSSGMAVRDEATSIGALPAPAPGPVAATTGDDSGEVDLMWPRLPGAKSFIVQYADSPDAADGDWKFATTCTKSTCTATGLPAGARLWFRIAATGAAGQSPWSSPVTARTI